ncbi:MAG: hypothetical protein K2N44_04725 [Lachnospiraceae bacterium]|nr:hypothetical protein [Lachnospiraceae bacterium]
MKYKNNINLIKKITALVLALTILFGSPQHSHCSEPEHSSIADTHSLIIPHQNDI